MAAEVKETGLAARRALVIANLHVIVTTMNEHVRVLSQERAEKTRRKILAEARKAFAEHGYDGANVRDIAKAAGTTHSMITYHFGGKEQLWRAAVRDMFEVAAQELGNYFDESESISLEDRWRRNVRLYVRYCARHPEHARITIAETIRGGERLRWMVDEFVKPAQAWLRPVFLHLMEEGIVPRMHIESFVYAYVGMAQLPFVLAKEAELVSGYDMLSDEAIDRHADAILTLLRGPRAENAPQE